MDHLCKGKNNCYIPIVSFQFLEENTFDEEYKLFLEFAENGVLIFPGFRFYTSKPGYFRIVFTVASDHLTEGTLYHLAKRIESQTFL